MAIVPETQDRDALVRRVNELYHDYQSREFDVVHKHRHQVEEVFWRKHVVPGLIESNASHGVDLCTGTGYVPRILLQQLPPEITIRCIDISSKALLEARESLRGFGDRVTYGTADAASVPLPDASADWISISAALHHMPQPEAVLHEVDRILKPGGLFCLGHEPNERFFASRGLVALERTIWHAFWYLSPSRNARRIRRAVATKHDLAEPESREYLERINAALLKERQISSPLTLSELRGLVDIYTHPDHEDVDERGFDAPGLIQRDFTQYDIVSIVYSDYGGEMLRKHHRLRFLFDGMMGTLAPGRGMLFSWILRKPLPDSAEATPSEFPA